MTQERRTQLALLHDLRRAAPFDYFAFVLTDPETEVGVAPVAEIPRIATLPELIRGKYLADVNRWTRLGQRFVSLNAATSGELERSRLWREVMCHDNVVDVASGVLRDRYGCWGFVDLWRTWPSGPFAPRELARLSEVLPRMTLAVRTALGATFQLPGGAPALGAGPPVLLLSSTLDVLAETASVIDHLRELLPPHEGRSPVPASAYNVAAQLLAQEAGVDSSPAWARVHTGSGRWLLVRAARLGTPTADAPIAITFEEAGVGHRVDLLARTAGLSTRETELLTRLITGVGTRELAAQMCVSEHTINDHLKAIFDKTGIRTRRTLLACVRGAGAGST